MVKSKKDNKMKLSNSDFYNKIKNYKRTIWFLFYLIMVILIIGSFIYIYFNSFFKNFEFADIITNWVFREILITFLMAILFYHISKKWLYDDANSSLKELKNGRLFNFVNYIKKLISN